MEKENPNLAKNKVKWLNPLKDRTRVKPFVVPSQEDLLSALGSLPGEKWRIKKSLQTILPFFQTIKKPQPEDHLYLYEQDGQTYDTYISTKKNYIDKQKETVYVGTFYCNISKEKIAWILKNVKKFFTGCKVKLHHIKQIELDKFDVKLSQNGEKYYDAAKLIQYFKNELPQNAFSMAIITNLLLYNGDKIEDQLEEKYVFGLGSVKDRMSVMSFQEMVKKGYGNLRSEGEIDESQVNLQFLLKVVNHELSHTFGLRHCIYYVCLMNGTNGYKEAIKKVAHLCPICLRKLHHNIGFDISQRYEALGDDLSIKLHEEIEIALNQSKK